MSEIKIRSVEQFIKQINSIEKKTDAELFFRGHASKSWILEPAIFRSKEDLLKNEKNLVSDLITQCPEEFKDCQYTFEYLVKMQHYGLPTRLLDITSNALVALYFACGSSNKKEDNPRGQILIYQIMRNVIKNYSSDTVSVLSNLVYLDEDCNLYNEDERGRFIYFIKREKGYFIDRINCDADLSKVICVRAKLNNPRIIRQSGLFFLFGMGRTKKDPIKISEEDGIKQITTPHLVILPKYKQKIINELRYLGISEETLMPEIDIVAKSIKNRYSRKE
ncbi:unnamed protein product [Commensalibacter communis]|uniref:FRG domain-containing protein n=1 Tax=Commensalibacter communis TaxID=2972786 RepID=UPI0022FF4E8D|nr:FRG domain-containing protein [Commensalibacter communis]CAI3955972.1 unnamed protein product [Commensalibacter communis]CAI3956755.1 unnamed protein product [Commensalibacter communis]